MSKKCLSIVLRHFLILMALLVGWGNVCFGDVTTDALTVSGNSTVGGNLVVGGNATVTGSTTFVDGINNTPIGATTPSTGKFTSLESTTGLTVDAGGVVSKGTVAGGGAGVVGYADSGTAISNGDKLGNISLGGAKDNAHTLNSSSGMSAYATQNWNGTAAGTKLLFEVTPNGSTTRATAMTLDQDSTATFAASKHSSLDASTSMTFKGIPVSPAFSKNYLVDGSLDLHSVTTTAAITNPASYNVWDMWWTEQDGTPASNASVDATVPPGFFRSAYIKRNNGSSSTSAIRFGQTIESLTASKLGGKALTISFWAKKNTNYSATGGALDIIVPYGIGSDEGRAGQFSGAWTGYGNTGMSTSVTLTSAWQRFTFTTGAVPVGTTELGVHFTFNPTGTASTENDGFFITGIQLEEGSVATPYIALPFEYEALRARRFFQLVWGGMCVASSSSAAQCSTVLDPPMRTTPAVGTDGGAMTLSDTTADFIQTAASASIVNGMGPYMRTSHGNFNSALTPKQTYMWGTLAHYYTFDARL